MKKLLIAVVALVATVSTASAQSWGDLLKQVAGSAVTEIADKVTNGALSDAALNGTWNYAKPAVKFQSDNILSSLGGSAIESTVTSHLVKAYTFIGIKPSNRHYFLIVCSTEQNHTLCLASCNADIFNRHSNQFTAIGNHHNLIIVFYWE